MGDANANSRKRAVKSQGQEGFSEPAAASWNLRLPSGAWEKMQWGFQPQEMEDKWHIYAEGPDGEGRASVQFVRSWTGNLIFEIRLQVGDGGKASVTELVWEANRERRNGEGEEAAKEDVKNLCRAFFEVEFPEGHARGHAYTRRRPGR